MKKLVKGLVLVFSLASLVLPTVATAQGRPDARRREGGSGPGVGNNDRRGPGGPGRNTPRPGNPHLPGEGRRDRHRPSPSPSPSPSPRPTPRPGPGEHRRGPGDNHHRPRPTPSPAPDRRHRPAPSPAPDRRHRPAPSPVPDRRPGPDFGRHRNDPERARRIEQRRRWVREHRENRRPDFDHRFRRIRDHRSNWRARYNWTPIHRDLARIRAHATWLARYSRWIDHCPRPVFIAIPVIWHEPMPAIGYNWSYYDVEIVAGNLEILTREIYSTMADQVRYTPNQSYNMRLMRVLAELVDAAENYNEAVEENYDFTDSLHDLFYLEENVDRVEETLRGYSRAGFVDNEMRSLRYYVNELLWVYRQND